MPTVPLSDERRPLRIRHAHVLNVDEYGRGKKHTAVCQEFMMVSTRGKMLRWSWFDCRENTIAGWCRGDVRRRSRLDGVEEGPLTGLE